MAGPRERKEDTCWGRGKEGKEKWEKENNQKDMGDRKMILLTD